MKWEHSLTPYTKINSKWTKDLDVRPYFYKTLKGKHRPNTLWYKLCNMFSDPPSRVTKIKTKINKWGPIKFKSFCTATESTNKQKDSPQNGRKVFANEAINFQNIQKPPVGQYQKNK